MAESIFVLCIVCVSVCIVIWVLVQPFVPSWRSKRLPFALFTITL